MSTLDEEVFRDLYGDEYQYHQDYRNPTLDLTKLLGIVLPVILFAGAFLYTGLYSLDLVALAPLDLVWNWFVVLTPSRLLDFFDDTANPNAPQTHAAKSEKLRRMLGFDTPGGIMTTVAQASRRRLSSLPGIALMQRNESRPAGLGNWDNSCYQNSVLQGLASLDNFSNYLVDPNTSDSEDDKVDMKMADSLRDLIATLKDPANNGKRIWTPAALKSMSSWQQQDAQEYFSKVLDEIDKEVDKAAKAIKPARGFEADFVNENKPTTPSYPLGMSNLRNPLEGLLAQRVGCQRCGYSEGLSMVPFNCLTVPLGRSWSYNLSTCLDEYTKLEPIEGVECGKCTLLKNQKLLNTLAERLADAPEDDNLRLQTISRLKAVNEALEDDDYEDKTLTQKCSIPPKNRVTSTKSRQAVIARPPKSLVVHVNRSLFDEMTGELRKNSAEVRFPKTLDLGPWCLGSSGKNTNGHYEEWLLDPAQSMIPGSHGDVTVHGPIYELRAVVTHYGRHENGHYICYKKHPLEQASEQAIEWDDVASEIDAQPEEQWWRLSDDDVTKVNESTVQAQGGVFMLFYDCIESARPIPIIQPESTFADTLDLAAKIPLPEDASDGVSISDDDRSSSHFDMECSTATSLSGGDESHNEISYEPTKPIIIPPFLQSNDKHTESDRQKGALSSGKMVMV